MKERNFQVRAVGGGAAEQLLQPSKLAAGIERDSADVDEEAVEGDADRDQEEEFRGRASKAEYEGGTAAGTRGRKGWAGVMGITFSKRRNNFSKSQSS